MDQIENIRNVEDALAQFIDNNYCAYDGFKPTEIGNGADYFLRLTGLSLQQLDSLTFNPKRNDPSEKHRFIFRKTRQHGFDSYYFYPHWLIKMQCSCTARHIERALLEFIDKRTDGDVEDQDDQDDYNPRDTRLDGDVLMQAARLSAQHLDILAYEVKSWRSVDTAKYYQGSSKYILTKWPDGKYSFNEPWLVGSGRY